MKQGLTSAAAQWDEVYKVLCQDRGSAVVFPKLSVCRRMEPVCGLLNLRLPLEEQGEGPEVYSFGHLLGTHLSYVLPSWPSEGYCM